MKVCFGLGEVGSYVTHLLIGAHELRLLAINTRSGFYLQTFLLNVAKVDEYEVGGDSVRYD